MTVALSPNTWPIRWIAKSLVLTNLVIKKHFTVILICILFIMNKVKYIFIYSKAIFTFSVNCLIMIFVHFRVVYQNVLELLRKAIFICCTYCKYFFSLPLLSQFLIEIPSSKFFIQANFFLIFCFLGPHPQHIEISRLGVQWELQLQAYATATATQDPSSIFDLQPQLIPKPDP